ncbi:hypothetical protein BH20ACT5_BH20ACT5_07990 [soil metagenome]
MADRRAHLVGSIPAPDAAAAMRMASELLGPLLRNMPDGETGERHNWIIHMIEGLRAHPDLELAKDGDWSDYDKTPRFRIRKGRRLYGANLDFGVLAAAEGSWPAFVRLREETGRADLSFQVGIPGDFDLAMFTLGPVGALRHRRAFTEAMISEIRAVHARFGDEVIFQLEVPAELVLLARMPGRLQPAAAGKLGREIAALAAAAPEGARFGVHLCLGDMNHRALGNLADVAPLVRLGNAIADRWPDGRPLEFLHAPFAAADLPPPTDAGFYAPLAEVSLPGHVRFIAGFAHEDRSLDEQRRIRALIDGHVGRPVDIAAACGFGRRDPDSACAVMVQMVELCEG